MAVPTHGASSLEGEQPRATCHVEHAVAGRQGGTFQHGRSCIAQLGSPERLIEIGGSIPPVALDASLEVGIHGWKTGIQSPSRRIPGTVSLGVGRRIVLSERRPFLFDRPEIAWPCSRS